MRQKGQSEGYGHEFIINKESVYLRFVLDVQESRKFTTKSKTNAAVDAYQYVYTTAKSKE